MIRKQKAQELRNKSYWVYYLGILFGIITLVVKYYADRNPNWIEDWYGQGLFTTVRTIWNAWHNLIPIPLLYISLLCIIIWFIIIVRSTVVKIRARKFKGVYPSVIQIIGFLGILISGFYWLWGFNYSRSTIEKKVNLKLDGLTQEQTLEEYAWVTNQIFELANSPKITEWRDVDFRFTQDLEAEVREGVLEVLNQFDFPADKNAPITILRPKGTLLRISTAGFYWPFSGESHIDGGLYPLQWPSVIAHELFHAYGVTDEGECNFLALLACLKSNDRRVAYSGLVGYWQYVASDARFHLRDGYAQLREELPEDFRNDVKMIYQYLNKYPDILPKLRNMIYNSYLKSQGISEGMKSYSKVVMLNYAWRMQSYRLN